MWSMHPTAGLNPACSFLSGVEGIAQSHMKDFTEDLVWY